jgi:hypothetical protein
MKSERGAQQPSNSSLGISVALIAVALALVTTQFSGAAQIALIVVLFLVLLACLARLGANLRSGRQ